MILGGMTYRAVKNRVAVHMNRLPVRKEGALAILAERGVTPIDVDMRALALACVGTSAFKRGAHPKDAPGIIDCSGLIKWLFGQRGIWLPRRSIQQFLFKGEEVALADARAGDVIFRKGRINYHDDAGNLVGHVGILIDNTTVVQARNSTHGIVTMPLEEFIANDTFTGVRRFIPKDEEVITFQIADDSPLFIETEDDILWAVRQHSHNPNA